MNRVLIALIACLVVLIVIKGPVVAHAWVEYDKACASAGAEYYKVCALAWAIERI